MRLKEVRLAKGMTLGKFYGPITRHVSNFSAIENGKRKIGERLSKDIEGLYRINADWLQTGEGKMFMDDLSEDHIPAVLIPEAGVPFFNVNLSELSLEEDSLFEEPPEYYVNYRPFNDCDAYLPIYGESMYPRYASGEIIAVREIKNYDIIQWGEAYLVVADGRANDIITVKLLFEHTDDKKIVLRSCNPNFKGDTVLDKEVIKRLFIVKGKVTRNQL